MGFYGASSQAQQSAGGCVSPHGHIILIPRQSVLIIRAIGEAANINAIVFFLTRTMLEPTKCHPPGEYATKYTLDAVAQYCSCIDDENKQVHKQ